MFKRMYHGFFVFCIGILLIVQTAYAQDKNRQDGSAKPAAVSHNNQAHQQVQSHQQAQSHQQVQSHQQPARPQAVPQRTFQQQSIPMPTHVPQPFHQENQGPRVYAVPEPQPIANNRLLNRQHHKHWQPRYNFYSNEYHFYPYVNIASTVELSAAVYSINYNGQNYFYDQGTFYIEEGGQYVAIPPPVGIIVNPIASQARQINVNGQIYYRYKGVFYVQNIQGYQVINPVESDSE